MNTAILVAAALAAAPVHEPEEQPSSLLKGILEEEDAPATEVPSESKSPALSALKTLYKSDEIVATWGGRIMWDLGFFSANEETYGDDADGVEARRARFYAKVKLYDTIEAKAQYDFAGGDTDFADVYIGLQTELGTLLFGHFKEPFGLEEQTSSRYITFMERSTATEAFSPARNTGIGIFGNTEEANVNWGLGVFKDTNAFGDGRGDGEYAVTGRLAGTFWNQEGADVLHWGASGSYREDNNEQGERFRSRPEAHILNRAADTGRFAADDTTQFGLEGAWVNGPISFQGEYISTTSDPVNGSNLNVFGWYGQASYFITGENRNYTAKGARFGRIMPKRNFDGSGLGGAWEVALRYSQLNLNDSFSDDKLDNITLGLNWYLNPHTRIMTNYIHSEADGPDDMDALMFRFQVDW